MKYPFSALLLYFLFILFNFCIPDAGAKSIYIGNDREDYASCGKIESPCGSSTFTLLNQASCGDFVFLEPGYYIETFEGNRKQE